MRVRLEDVCEKESSKLKQSDVIGQNGMYPVYGASGYLGNINTYQQSNYYIAVVKDGAGIGRTMLLPPESSIIGTMQYLIPKDNVLPEYLYYVVKAKHLEKYFSGATIPHIYFKDYKNEQFDLVSFEEQREIINRLKKIEIIIDNLSKNLLLLDELVKARFVEMFGDPFLNEKGWITKPLIDMGNCKNGMNFHYNENGCEVKCLGVGDFKDLSIINNIESLQTVSLNEMPSEEYMLRDNDIVFVRSNGNKALVGRSIVIYPGDVPTTFSGFCIRYRKYDDSIIVPYLLHVLKTDSFRNKMVGRGANIQNLNQQILASLIIPVPPLELQNQFASFVEEIDKSRSRIQKSLEASQELFDSLMQEYFG